MRSVTAATLSAFVAAICLVSCSHPSADAELPYDQAPLLGAEMPDWPDWAKPLIGNSLVDTFEIQAADTCIGYVDDLAETYARDQGYRLEGWAWDKAGSGPFEHFVTTDELLIIRGASVNSIDRPDVAIAMPELVTETRVGYQIVSFATEFRPTVYGLDYDTMRACPLALVPKE